jgi:hypothetical protein
MYGNYKEIYFGPIYVIVFANAMYTVELIGRLDSEFFYPKL